jgi:hypothetical protein
MCRRLLGSGKGEWIKNYFGKPSKAWIQKYY